jgi:hypothetical protein
MVTIMPILQTVETAFRRKNHINTRLVLKGLLALISLCVELQGWNYTYQVSDKRTQIDDMSQLATLTFIVYIPIV